MSSTDAVAVATKWVSAFGAALKSGDYEALAALFVEDGYLRDILVFTWDSRTIQGRSQIQEFLSASKRKDEHYNVQLVTDKESPFLSPTADKSDPENEAVKLAFTFETEKALCRGAATLVLDSDSENGDADDQVQEWRALNVYTTVADWKGHEEVPRKPDEFVEESGLWRATAETNPTVLIVGAGLSGLQLAARLRQSRISCLLIEKEPRVGDNWRKRYPSLKLHVPSCYCRLLYQSYPSNYPTYIPKELVADYLESYVLTQGLCVWTASTIDTKPSYDASTKSWTIVIKRGTQHTMLHPTHLVMALGPFGDAYIPPISGQGSFTGSIVHSSQYTGGASYASKRVLVLGAANSASDICVDLSLSRAHSVTLLQRSPTVVHSAKYIHSLITGIFPEDVPMEVTDFKMGATPVKMMLEALRAQQKEAREVDRDLLERFKESAFRVWDGPTGAGYVELGLTRGGGYLFDFGFASLIAEGAIKVKSDVSILRMTDKTVVFSDASEIEVDSVIYATGFQTVRDTYKRILGDDIVEGTPQVWDLDGEGEVRGVYRPTGHPGLWYVAGDFAFSRRCSKQLALLIKASELGYYKP